MILRVPYLDPGDGVLLAHLLNYQPHLAAQAELLLTQPERVIVRGRGGGGRLR